jgi:hypothetical protein
MCVIVVDKWAEIKGERKGGGRRGWNKGEREREEKLSFCCWEIVAVTLF